MTPNILIDNDLCQLTLKSISDAVFITDAHDSIIYASPSATTVLGYSIDEINTLATLEALLGTIPLDRTTLEKSGEIRNIEHVTSDRHGNTHTLLVHVKQVSINDGVLVYTCSDITERKLHEEELRMYEYIVSTSEEHMSFIDTDYIYQAVNKAYLSNHNKTRDEIIGHSVADLLGEDIFRNAVKQKLDRCLQGDTVNYSDWFEFNGSGRRFMDVTYLPYKNAMDSAVEGVVVVSRDITERKQAEEEKDRIYKKLQDSQNSLKIAQKIAQLGSWEWDLTSDVTTFSEEFYHLFGFDSNTTATRDDCLSRIHPDDRTAVDSAVEAALQAEKEYSIEYRIILPDGQQKIIHGMGEVIRDENNKPLRFYGTVHDITERKHAENQLAQARDELEQRVTERTAELQHSNQQLIQANEAKSQFLTRMSHELRTPLNSILGFAQILDIGNNNDLTDKQKQSVGYILKGGWHLLELVNDLLDLAAIEANKVELHLEPINLIKCIQESLDLMLPLASQRNITFNNTLDPCTDKTVKADYVRLKQVLLNLLSNAVKYNHDGGRITLHCEQIAINTVRISITDTGSGIPADDIPTLFEPFNRLYLHTHALEGTGIGLTITKQLIERMNGTIGVVSQPGHGSTFWFELQLCGAPAHNGPAPATDISSAADKGGTETVLLYIEDSPSHIQLMESLVDNISDIRLLSAHTPLLGLELAQAHVPDIIVLDICLPGMDGFEVLEKLRSNEVTRDIPVIAVSANAMNRDIEKGLRAGFRRYLTKPINVVEFNKTLTELLQDNSALR